LRQSLLRFGYAIVTKPLKLIRTDRGLKPKADVDAEIITEALERKDDFDIMILFSGDSDFYYPLKRLQEKYGKKVIVISTRYSVSKELLRVADDYIDIGKLKPAVARGQSFGEQKSPSFATGGSPFGESSLATAIATIPDVLPFVKPALNRDGVSGSGGGEWIKANQLQVGQYIATAGTPLSFLRPPASAMLKALRAGKQESIQIDSGSEPGMTRRGEANPVFERIVSIEKLPAEQVYDIEVEATHNFVANGIVAHNTYISGNLGIGTGVSSPRGSLDVTADEDIILRAGLGATDASVSGNNDIQLAAEDRIDLYANSYSLTTSGNSVDILSAGRIDLSAKGTLTLDTSQNNTNIVLTPGTGNVGIGSTAPVYKLRIIPTLF